MSQDPRRSFLMLSDVPTDYAGSSSKVVSVKADETGLEFTTPSSAGSVTGPGTSTDNALARFDGAGGTLIQNSLVIVDDSGNMTGVASILVNSNTGLKVKDTDASHALTFSVASNLTANRTLSIFTGDADRSLTIGGTVSFAGNVSIGGAFTTSAQSLTLTLTGSTNVTLPTSGTLATLSNKVTDFTAPTSDFSMNNNKITNLATPSASTDAATKAYVDGVASGLSLRSSVRVGTTADLNATYNGGAKTLTCNVNGAISVDSVSLSLNDRVLVKNQTTGQENGIYSVTTVGTGGTPFVLTRATDADTSAEVVSGLYTFITAGTTQAATGYVLTTADPITLDTTALSFTQFSGASNYIAGNGLTLSSLTFNVGAGTGITVNADNIAVDFSAVQALDATLTALAAYNTNGFLVQTAADTFTGRTITGTNGVSVVNGDGLAGNPSLTVSITALTEDSSPDSGADYVMTYDNSAATNKKVLLSRVANSASDIYRQVGTSPLECWYSSGIDCSTQITFTTAVAATTHTMYAVPFLPGRGGTLDSIAIYVQTGVANTVGRVGLYSATSSTNLYPNALVVDSGEFDTSTAGKKSATISATVSAGTLYWLVFSFDNTTATLSGAQIKGLPVTSVPNVLGVGSTLNTVPNTMLSITGQTYGALPGTFVAGASVTTGSVPMAWVRFSA